ncbi:hypothetical protein ACV3UL_14405 [Clostridium perfringens]
MKKRVMKKWIPKDSYYCYGHKRTGRCKWLRFNDKVEYERSGFCMYLQCGDWFKEGTILLWDECKACGVSDNLNYKSLREPRRRKWQTRNKKY